MQSTKVSADDEARASQEQILRSPRIRRGQQRRAAALVDVHVTTLWARDDETLTAQQIGVIRPMAGAAQPGVQVVHPAEVALIALGEALDHRDRGPVDSADHAHLREQGEPGQPVAPGGSGVGGGGEHPRPVAGVCQDGVQQSPADAGTADFGKPRRTSPGTRARRGFGEIANPLMLLASAVTQQPAGSTARRCRAHSIHAWMTSAGRPCSPGSRNTRSDARSAAGRSSSRNCLSCPASTRRPYPARFGRAI
jgi:hypothetical protein